MRVRRFLLTLALVAGIIFPAASFGADADVVVLYVTGSATIVEPTPEEEPSGDVKGLLKFPAPSDRNYTFATVTDVLDFAKNPTRYIPAHYNGKYNLESYNLDYESPIDTALTNIEVSIEILSLDKTVDLTDYSVIEKITFKADSRIITAPEGSRHFKVSGSSKTRTFNDIIFSGEGNSGQGSSGGVEVNSGTANFNNLVFSDFDTTWNGGALLITGGIVTVEDSTFDGCSTTGNGGAIAITGGSATIQNTTFAGNSALYGGAIYTSSTVSIDENVKFNTEALASPNTAERGGAIYVASGGTAKTSGSGITFFRNSATSWGGAIYVNEGGEADISGSGVSFTKNNADNGGAIYVAGGTADVSGYGVLFDSNTASSDGGAIYASSQRSTLNLTGDNLGITSNVAKEGDGGAIYLASRVGLTLNNSNATLEDNEASLGNGGAIYAAGANAITLGGSLTINGNKAPEGDGGAIYLAYTQTATAATALNIIGTNEVVFTGNEALNGGAIYAEANANMTFTNPEVTFSENKATSENGGALWLTELSQLPDGTVNFLSNEATNGSGGAIYVEGSASSSATIGTTKLYTFRTNSADIYGGAFCSNSGDVTFIDYVGDRSITSRNDAKGTTGGGGFAASISGILRINNCSITYQSTGGSGGAIWAKQVIVTSADFGSSSYPNYSRGTGGKGGGAIYSDGLISISNATFSGNRTDQNGGAVHAGTTAELTVSGVTFSENEAEQLGGAIYADTSTVTIGNSYFDSNKANNGNGGAIALRYYCNTNINSSTFTSNESQRFAGGAIYAQGRIVIAQSYFRENLSQRSGGAIYFDQSNSQEPYSFFSISTSMLEDNSTNGENDGGNGGGIFVASNRAVITSCTFNKNHIDLYGNSGEGGGVYLNTAMVQSGTNTIENCTFYENTINEGADGSSGGGGLSVHCEGRTEIKSCTFSMNVSRYKGGAIYKGSEDGTLTLAGTIAVGNATSGIYDIWSDGKISSGGYNRIGVYGTGSGVTDFYSEARNETDRTSYPAKGWTKATFFGSNVLSDNKRPDIGDTIPPYIGSVRADGGQVRLLTLMLNEADDLPLTDRATNVIPYTRRTSFPNNDERGVSRVSGGAEINLDVGACFFDGTRPDNSNPPISSYTITKVEISGIPNNLRRVGQTASLLAKIYYSNGRTALGGTGDGEEPIEWSSDKPNIIRINKDTGDIVVLNFTPANTYVTITAKTIRTDLSGNQVSDSKPIRVTEYTPSYLNSTQAIMDYISDFIEDIAEYFISLQLPDTNPSYVSASSFQSAFSSAWGGVSASQVTDISDGSLTLNKQTTGYATSVKNAAVNVNMRNRKAGDVFPLTYAWMFSGEELENILGYNLSGRSMTDEAVDTIFSTLRLDFQGAATSLPVIGSGGVKASEARAAGALTLEKSDAEKGLRVELTAYLANVSTSTTSGTSASANDGPQLIASGGTKLLVVPDGSGNDGAIYGTMWAASGGSGNNGDNNNNNNGDNNGNSSSGGGGGGGCNSGLLTGMLAGIFVLTRRRRDVQEG